MVKTLLSRSLFGAAHMAGFYEFILNFIWGCVGGGVDGGVR